MKHAALLALFLCLITVPALAQDLFIKKKAEEEKTIDEKLGLDPQKNKAQPKNTQSFAAAYYKNCIKKQHPILTKDSLESLCACTSVELESKMSPEDIKTMLQDTPQGQKMRNKMLETVYAPCMKYPTYDLLHGECIRRENVQRSMRNYKKVCDCLADTMSRYVSVEAPQIIRDVLWKNPNSTDPLGDYVNSAHFNRVSGGYMTQCIKIHEFGIR